MKVSFYIMVGVLLVCGITSLALPNKPCILLQEVDLFIDGQRALHVQDHIGIRMPALIANNGVALIPVNVVQELLGDTVNLQLSTWGIVQISNADGITIAMKLDDKTALILPKESSGTQPIPMKLSVAPVSYDYGALYVPAQIVEKLGHTVRWDAATHTIHITKQ